MLIFTLKNWMLSASEYKKKKNYGLHELVALFRETQRKRDDEVTFLPQLTHTKKLQYLKHTQLLSRNVKGGPHGQSSLVFVCICQVQTWPLSQGHSSSFLENIPVETDDYFNIHASFPTNLVLVNATWFMFTYVNIPSMKKRSSSRENTKLPSLLPSLQSQHRDAGKYHRGHCRFHWIPSEVLPIKIVFSENRSLHYLPKFF